MTPAYYNEIDPQAAQWLRELIARDLIAPTGLPNILDRVNTEYSMH